MTNKLIHAAVGIIQRPNGDILFGLRPEGKPHAGWWEFPGGKVEPNETVLEALGRELHEELGIRVTQCYPWVTHIQHYAERSVRLSFCIVTQWEGEPRSVEGQALQWAKLVDGALDQTPQISPSPGPLLAGAYPALNWLRIPQHYAITQLQSPETLSEFLLKAEQALHKGLKLIQFREPNWVHGCDADSAYLALNELLRLTRAHGAHVLVNSCHPIEWAQQADGIHLRSADLMCYTPGQLAKDKWLAASTHNEAELTQARTINAHFVVLGHVQASHSHPNTAPLGWQQFEKLNQAAGLPVFALGGLSPASLHEARLHSAHGVAGISQFWD